MLKPHATWASVYDEIYELQFGNQYLSLTEETVKFINSKKANSQNFSIIDFGAGTGRTTIPLLQTKSLVTAVEPCQEMLDILLSKAKNQNLLERLTTIQSTASEADLADSFNTKRHDVATCIFTVIAYILTDVELKSSFQNFAASLKPGGHLLIDIPSRSLFASHQFVSSEIERTVNISSINDNSYNYSDEICKITPHGKVVYRDNFILRYWEITEVNTALMNVGFVKSTEQLSLPQTGSTYLCYQKV